MLEAVIGIEVHVELKSNSKVFSDTQNSYSKDANTYVSAIDLGYPGTLPRLNKKVIDMALAAALAFNCKINKIMRFDRKNYFYPDLPKGYQITQNDLPIGYDGYIEINVDGEVRKIDIERIHIEEDTCKSIHSEKGTLLNANRAGVPLIEIVTKPVLKNHKEAVLYLEKLREILLYLGVSDVKIEEGSMRCDANISLREVGSKTLGTKTEIKNIGSISNVGISILYEIERQKELIKNGDEVKAETRRFDDKNNKTILMRVKETGNDYRYFPEPDIPFIHLSDEWINDIKSKIPVFADALRDKYNSFGISHNVVKTVTSRLDLCNFLENVINEVDPVISANLLTGDILSYLNRNNLTLNQVLLKEDNFKQLVISIQQKEISSKQAKDILSVLLIKGGSVKEIIKELNFEAITDDNVISEMIKEVIMENSQSIIDYKNGNERALKYLMGQAMKITKGSVDPALVNKMLIECIDKN